jgi:hypothetical protein
LVSRHFSKKYFLKKTIKINLFSFFFSFLFSLLQSTFSFIITMADLLKEGSKHLSGLEEAVLKNCEAVLGLAKIVRTSYGPNGV